ncbi:MAG: AAA family ATPase [Spirochaetota bacterium]
MLLTLTVSNFRGMKTPQTISWEAVKDKRLSTDHLIAADDTSSLLRQVALLGANGAGKSSCIKALEILQRLVLDDEDKAPLSRLNGTSFAYDPATRAQPVSITIEVLIPAAPEEETTYRQYTYTVEADGQKVHRESLFLQDGRSLRRLFERELSPDGEEGDEHYTYRWGKTYSGEKKRFGKKLGAGRLFLGSAARAGSTSLQDLYAWFSQQLIMVPVGLSDNSEEYCVKHMQQDDKLRRFVIDLLVSMDFFDIRDIRLFPRGETSSLVYIHTASSGGYASLFKYEPVSVRRLTMIGTAFYLAANRPAVLVADDFGILLHEKVVEKLYSLFADITADTTSQLLTADSSSTALEEGLLRLDEIYLVEKQLDGSTQIRSLADFNIKKQDNVRRLYLQGAFGAIPILSDASPFIEGGGNHAEET